METQANPRKAKDAKTAKTTRHLAIVVMTAVFRPGEIRTTNGAVPRSFVILPEPVRRGRSSFQKQISRVEPRPDRRRLRRFRDAESIIGVSKTQCQTKTQVAGTAGQMPIPPLDPAGITRRAAQPTRRQRREDRSNSAAFSHEISTETSCFLRFSDFERSVASSAVASQEPPGHDRGRFST